MTVKILHDDRKKDIVEKYKTKQHTIAALATSYGVSTRTIGRILEEAGLATPVPRLKGEAHLVMQLLKKNGLDLQGLTDLINGQGALFNRPLTKEEVQHFLNVQPQEILGAMFYTAALIKVAEMHNAHVQTATLRMQEQAQASAKSPVDQFLEGTAQ